MNGTVEGLVERLRAQLPVCPFDPKAPKNNLEASDPCPVCGDYGDERSKNLCRGADTRVLNEAADRIEQLEAQLGAGREALEMFVSYGCPVCSGDCASANPPMISCPMQQARAALTIGSE